MKEGYTVTRTDCADEQTHLLTNSSPANHADRDKPAHENQHLGVPCPGTDPKVKDPPWLTSKRWQVSYLSFLGCFFLYSLRVDLSVSIVCMCNDTGKNSSTEFGKEKAEFTWGESTKSSLLSAYFYGYLLLSVPGGWLAGRYGATRVISLAVALSAICTLLVPVAARNSLPAFYALRVATGLFSSSIAPGFQALLGRWAPPRERTRLSGFTYSGGFLGSIATFSLSGVLCDSGFDGGWPSIFYIIGGSALLWTLVWHVVVYDSPSSHPTISCQEREYITSNLQQKSEKSPRLPWREMFTSAPFWALIFAMGAMGWVDYTIMTSLPQYLQDILDFDISQDGFLSAIPSVTQFVSSLLIGPVADNIRNRGVRTGAVRKIFQTLTFIGRAACLTSAGYVTHGNRYLAVGLVSLSGFFAGLQQAGYVANFIDIAPRFAGVMYGVGNSMATLSGIVAPLIVGAVTTGKSRTEWQTVFFICAGISTVATVFFDCCAQGHVQPWAVADDDGSGLCYDVSIEPEINHQIEDAEDKTPDTRKSVNS
ncbi:hypothetical protein RRG08_044866 [Elysia crispata]|uniref:Major facilitator superfamily (MFS) profile domain-containing protein n=1 Tax=Elysia crispata TaxID=231223 RepID=A0AAE1A5I2_9GAST|nr:hypothetical protein RRG08_044866 [Elysia crispata]